MIEKIEGKILDLEQRGRSLDYLKSEYLLLADELMDSIIFYNKDGDSEIQNDMMAEINGLINLKDELILELIEFANHIVLLDSELDKNELDTYFENKNNHILPLQNRTKLINKLNSEYILSAKRYIKYECYLENEEDIPLHHEQIKTIKGKYIESKEKLLAELKCYIGFIESIDSNLAEIN